MIIEPSVMIQINVYTDDASNCVIMKYVKRFEKAGLPK